MKDFDFCKVITFCLACLSVFLLVLIPVSVYGIPYVRHQIALAQQAAQDRKEAAIAATNAVHQLP